MTYDHIAIEKKWQEQWEKLQIHKTPDDFSLPKYYILDMFPYPSGAGLHVGHPEGYTATDIVARYKRMKGFNVLHPMGWDAFGLPAERYAMQTGIHPAKTTQDNIATFRRQLQSLGFCYDWSREINTTDPGYYKFTQWIFLKIFNSWYDTGQKKARPISELEIPHTIATPEDKENYINGKRLAYIDNIPVNWCAELGTVLANEEVDEWVEKGYKVERKPMRQWMLRITAYAERLLEDLDLVDWPQGTLELQKNWIGKSAGAEIDFPIKGTEHSIKVFTTRPDTIYGVTYMALAPEHPLVASCTTPENRIAVNKYVESTSLKSELDRQVESARGEKSGVFTGSFALNPINGKEIPVYIADYIMMGYGTGAIMAVPAHDERDFAFARHFSLGIQFVVTPERGKQPPENEPFTGNGFAINSPEFEGQTTEQAKETAIVYLEKNHLGNGRIQFKLRDWLFSRQRYWGEPVPISFDEKGNYIAAQEDELPLLLPPTESFQPAQTGESPLANLPDWVNHTKNGKKLQRETNTMPQWAGSCWYYLRFADAHNTKQFISPENEKYWLRNGVDLYIGGAEHAVLHLLYARFWHKVLFDWGYVSYPEPFQKLIHQGIILGEDNVKMSKSRGNVINPDDVVHEHGADCFRMYEMFMGPLEQMKPWSSKSIEGISRFLARVYRLYAPEDEKRTIDEPAQAPIQREILLLLNKTIKKVTDDIERLSFNTAIAQLMVFINECYRIKHIGKEPAEIFLKLLSPFAPHLCDELAEKCGYAHPLIQQSWPTYDEKYLVSDTMEIVFQVNGKVRGKGNFPPEISDDVLKEAALSDEGVKRFLAGANPRRVIVVKNKLVSIVV